MKRTDALWLLALPIYQVIGTARHELSHAAVGILQGTEVVEIEILPSIDPSEGLLWGYVQLSGGQVDWLMSAAPYLCDMLVFAIFLPLCICARSMPHWLYVNCFILGIVSPLVNTGYNYLKVFTGQYGDVDYLMFLFPDAAVHAAFLLSIAVFGTGAWMTARAHSRVDRTQDCIPARALGIVGEGD